MSEPKEAEVVYDDVAHVREMGSQEVVGIDSHELALLDRQIVTAKRYPRSVAAFLRECEALATVDEPTAGSMFYQLKRSQWDDEAKRFVKKLIEGPSIRLAEIASTCWTNLHVASRTLDVSTSDRFARAQSVAWDLERNVRVGVECSRRITKKDGSQYSEDMIGVTQAAALSIAHRNAVLKVIPRVYVDSVLAKAKAAFVGKGKTMAQRKEAAVEEFKKHKVTEQQLLDYLDRKDWSDVDLDDFVALRGALTSVRDGDVTAEALFANREAKAAEETKTAESNLDAALGGEVKERREEKVETKTESKPVTPEPKGAPKDDIDRLFS